MFRQEFIVQFLIFGPLILVLVVVLAAFVVSLFQ